MRRLVALLLALAAVLAAVAHCFGKLLPSITWFYSLGDEALHFVSWLAWLGQKLLQLLSAGRFQPTALHFSPLQVSAANWVIGLLFSAWALSWAWRLWRGRNLSVDPITARRFQRFRSIRRGWVSLWIVLILMGLACLDMVVVGKRALVVQHEGQWYFPAFQRHQLDGSRFGQQDGGEADYRALQAQLRGATPGFVIMPLIPWSPTYDAEGSISRPLARGEDGLWRLEGHRKPFSGVATVYTDAAQGRRLREVRIRDGQFSGVEERFDENGKLLGFITWHDGQAQSHSPGLDPAAGLSEAFTQTKFNPLPPHFPRRHYLGTNSDGWDVSAQLFGGWQVLLRGLVPFLLISYLLGILLGIGMGYFGGWIDLIGQRLVEILASVPLLLLIIILTSNLGKDKVSLLLLVGLVCLFHWIGIATLLRSATYKERARDYVAAAKSLGASNLRIVLHHILPNIVAIIVTLLPFEIVFFSGFLTSLDFIGFGLPDHYASWGRLLQDGLDNLASPWIVSSVFFVLVFILLLFTFIGEALREAFDPKKFTTYR